MFPGLLKLLEAECAVMRPIAGLARVIHFPLALVLHVTSIPLGADYSPWGPILQTRGSDRLGLLFEGDLWVGGHAHHHVGGVHLVANVRPGC